MKFSEDMKLTPKVENLIKTAEELFFRYGISRVSVDEICQRSKVSKMTFYRYFSNKTDCALFILNKIYAEGRVVVNAILEEEIPFAEKLEKVLATKQQMADSYSMEFLEDFLNTSDPLLRAYLESEKEKWFLELREIFRRAQEDGEVRSDINLDFVIYMLNVMRDIFRDENLRKLYSNVNELMRDAFTLMYYGILPREEER